MSELSERITARAARDFSPAQTSMVGRDRALQKILASAQLAAREGATVVIIGDAGIGKSALLDAVAPRLADWIVLRVRADRREAEFGYASIETLSRVITAIAPSASLPQPLPAGDDHALVGRHLLHSFDLLPGPVCLIVDDAQWMDPASAGALRYAARRMAGQPFLLIATARHTPTGQSGFLDDVASLAAHHQAVSLDPFTERETQMLATEILGFGVSRRSARRMTEATNGSPLLVRALIEQLGDSISGASHPAVWDTPLPPSAPVAQAVAAALDDAAPDVRAAAELIAVLRDPVSAPALGTIADRLGIAIDPIAASELGLVHSIDRDRVIRFEPAHTLFADAIEANVSRTRRAAVHRVAADVLTGRSALRHRVDAAEREDRALAEELLSAARDSADHDDSDTAMSYARSALHLAPAGDYRERCLLELGLLAMRTRKHERVLDVIDGIEALPPSPIRDAILVELRIMRGDVAGSFAAAHSVLGDSAGTVSGARAGASASTDEATPDADPMIKAIRSHAAGCVPMLQMATRDFGPVLEQVRVAREYLELVPTDPGLISDPALRWLVRPREDLLWLLGWELTAAAHLRRFDIIERAAAEVDRLVADPSPSAAFMDVLVTRARAYILTGELRRARADLERAGTFTFPSQPSWTTNHGRTMLSHVQFLLGEWDKSIKVGDTAVATVLDETVLTSWPVALASSALARAARGDEKEVTDRLAAASRARTVLGTAYDSDIRHIVPAELARALGQRSKQLEAADAGRAAAEGTSTMGWMTYRIDALAALGRAAEARDSLTQIQEPTTRWRPYYGSLAWLEGRVLEAEGAFGSALVAYRRATTDPESEVFPFPRAVAFTDLARTEAAAGYTADALVSLKRASEIFERLRAEPYLRRTLAERDRLTIELTGAPGSQRDQLLEKLTVREREVARSVAAGMTNKEIATSLFVSVTTVNFHVRNILAKLTLTSRHELRRILTTPRGRDGRSPVNS